MFDVFDMSVFVRVCSRVFARPPGRPVFVWLLISGHLISWSPSEGLVEAAISTQHSPQATWKAFYPALCTLFLINIPHSPASQAKLPHLCLFCRKPTSPQHSIVFCFVFLDLYIIFSHFISPAGCHFALKRVGAAQWDRNTHMFVCTQTSLPSILKIGMNSKKSSKASAWHPCFFFFPLCLSEREPFIACSVAADKAGPFVCGSHSESDAGEPHSKILARHRSALPAPLAK